VLGGSVQTPAAFTLAAALPLHPVALAVLEVATLMLLVAAGSLPPPPHPASATIRRTATIQSTDTASVPVRSLPTAASPTKRVGGQGLFFRAHLSRRVGAPRDICVPIRSARLAPRHWPLANGPRVYVPLLRRTGNLQFA